MNFTQMMSKIRRADNKLAKSIMRHSYLMIFQLVLFVIFMVWLINTSDIIALKFKIDTTQTIESILITHSINSSIIIFLILLNSFWMLYMFSTMQRMSYSLKDISYHTNRTRIQTKKPPSR